MIKVAEFYNSAIVIDESGKVSEYAKCDECGQLVSKDEAVYLDEYEMYVCEKCLDEYYVRCEVCGRYVRECEVYYLDAYGCYVCERCYDEECVRCNDCDAILFRNDAIYIERYGIYVCEYCRDRYYTICDICGEYVDIDEAIYEDDYIYCPDCYEEYCPIKPYNWRPNEWIFFSVGSDDNEGLFLGIELEVDSKDNVDRIYVADKIVSAYKELYCKNDGSLSDNGFEIVSYPMTIKYLKQFNWKELFEFLIKEGYRSHDAKNCGLHIHVSKSFFGAGDEYELNVAKLVIFFEKYWSKVLKLSRRTERQYKEWCDRYIKDVEGDVDDESILLETARKVVKDGQESKYYAINLLHSNTIEFRIFRGTLKYESFMAAVEFVYNLCKYVKDKSVVDVLYSKWDDFVEWCKVNGKCEYLIDYMKERGVI